MTLSVILPNYNHARYLPESLDAILAQSYPASEIVLVDDASQDESIKVIEGYRARYPQVKLYRNERNLGPVETINRGIAYATGDYLAFCSADDRILSGFFEEGVRFLQEHSEVGLCTSNARYFKEDGNFFDVECKGIKEGIITPEELTQILRTSSFCIPSHTTIYRRECVIKYGGLNSELKMNSDFYMNYRIAFHTGIGYIPKVLASLRQLEGSYSGKAFRDKKVREQVFKTLCEKIQSEPESVRTCFIRSGVLLACGRKMAFYLVKRPPYWKFLFPIVRKKLYAS